MVELKLEQGSQEWLRSRIGIASGSRFKDILTEPKSKADKEAGKLSTTAETYLYELASMILTDEAPSFSSAATDWGHEHEPQARMEYELETWNTVEETGMFLHDSRKIGASPDGLVGDDGMIEIKCPFNSVNHVRTVVSGEMPKEHMPQVQGNLWLNGRQWCDFISFDPRISSTGRLFVRRIERDEKYIENLERRVLAFVKQLDRVLLESFGIAWDGITQRETQ